MVGKAENKAENSNVTLDFTALTTVIELNITTNTHELQSIEVSAANASVATGTPAQFNPLAGKFKFGTGTDKLVPYIAKPLTGSAGTNTDVSTTVSIDRTNLAARLTGGKTGYVYLAISPAGATKFQATDAPSSVLTTNKFTDLVFTFTDVDGSVVTKTCAPAGGITPTDLYRCEVNISDESWPVLPPPVPAGTVDLGIGVGGAKGTGVLPLYFATGNLIATYKSTPYPDEDKAPNDYYIADPAKGQYTANNVYSGTVFLNKERDLFKIGKVSSTGYWAANIVKPSVSGLSGTNISGNAAYDLVRYAAEHSSSIPDGFRSATNVEWTALYNNCASASWTAKYNNITGLKGYIIHGASAAKSRDGKDYSANSIFLPATGERDCIYVDGTTVQYRGVMGNYWSGTLATDKVTAYHLLFREDGTWRMTEQVLQNGLSLRPVIE
jgi:hypothetical protein